MGGGSSNDGAAATGGCAMHRESGFYWPICLALVCYSEPASPPPHRSTPSSANRRATSRLLASGLIGLALAVVLWGTGYKLSLYRPHPSPSVRVGVAKLWVGPQQRACVRSAHTKVTAGLSPGQHLFGDQNGTFHQNSGVTLEFLAASALSVRYRLLLSTLRSPPTFYL
jgi:hypothetical protein